MASAVVDSLAAACFSFMLMNSTHQVAQSPFRHRKVDFEDAENTADIPRIEMRTSIYTNTFTAKKGKKLGQMNFLILTSFKRQMQICNGQANLVHQAAVYRATK